MSGPATERKLDLPGRRALVVDDEPAIRSTLRRLLMAEGLEVETAADGSEGLGLARSMQPDIVLLDVMMPHVDGFAVCRSLKSDPETRLIPVVLLTGLGASEDRIRGIEAGADDFLTKPFDRAEFLARVRSLLRSKSYLDELERAESVVLTLARSIEGKDPYTEGHCERLAEYASALATSLDLPEDQVTALRRAGIVHDVGKIAVPDAILLKPAPLTDAEWTVMRRHPVVGERICQGLKSFRPVLPIIRHHHEHRDGSGYPDGLASDAIPLTARILQVVDVYDALTTDRPYRRALPADEALRIIDVETKRGWWDPTVVGAFTGWLANRPAGAPPSRDRGAESAR
jgi:putative two-component system response regulator